MIETGVGPFAQRSLDEALGFAVGARGIGAGETVSDAELTAGGGQQAGVIAGGVVGEQAADADAEACIVGDGGTEEGGGGVGALVGIELGESDAGVIVDGDMQDLPAGTASFVTRIAGDTVTRLGKAGQFLGVQVKQVAGMWVFIAAHGHDGVQVAHAVEMVAAQDAADGGAAQAGGLRDVHAGPTLSPQHEDLVHEVGSGLAR